MKNPILTKLRASKKEKGLTNKDMAKILNISKSMYSSIELGERRLSYDMAIKIANIFNLKPDELFYEDTNEFLKDSLI